MTKYSVYKARFQTKKGTWRTYVGKTRSIEVRKQWLKKKPVAWAKCAVDLPSDESSWEFELLEKNLDSNAAALAYEALHTAKLWVKAPLFVRGAAWSNPTLSEAQETQLRAVSKCADIGQLEKIAQQCPQGSLARHLKDVSFVTVKTETVAVKKRGRSGAPGNASRKSQIAIGCLHVPPSTPFSFCVGHFSQVLVKLGFDIFAASPS